MAGLIHRLARHFEERFAGQRQRLPVALHQLLAFAAVAFGNGTLERLQRAVARQDLREMEKRHLHHGVDARAELAFAGDFRGVHHEDARVFVIQHRLDFLRQLMPDFIRRVGRVNQKNTAGFQALGHLIFIDKLQLMAADKIRLAYQIRGVNGSLADAQVGNGQAARFFGVINEIALGVPRRRVADNFNVVFGGRNAAVAAQPVKQRLQARVRGQRILRQRQGEMRHVVVNPDGKARFRFFGAQFIEYRQHAVRPELFGGKPVTAADDARQAVALAAVKGFRQRGHHIQIKRLRLRARLFGAIEHRDALDALRQRRQQVTRAERAEQADFQHAHFFAASEQLIHHLFAGAAGGTHQDNHPFGLRVAVILKRPVLAARGGGEIVHRLFDMVIDRVIPGVGRLAGLEIGIRVGGGAADHRMFRVERAGAVGVDFRLRQQGADRVIGERRDFVDFM
ncbi:hypothetical protein BN128_1075 [Cronobacter sakazakii 696]|nr:hypothetical protein BN128_1075 [Cronobacter sakazakii 696]